MQLHRLVPAQPSEEPEVTGWHADPSNPDLIVHPDGRFMSMSAAERAANRTA